MNYFQDLKLQPEDSFILKVVQLQELLDVRHSVFVIGAAGTGKSQVNHFFQFMAQKYNFLN